MNIQSSNTQNFDLRNYYLFIKIAQNDFNGELNLTHIELTNGNTSQPLEIESVIGFKSDANQYTLFCKFNDEHADYCQSPDALKRLFESIHSSSYNAYIDLTADAESQNIDITLNNIIDIQLYSECDNSFSKSVAIIH
ncbi:hypothetical protein WE348_21740 (plasmid) [Alteromonas macleodii]|uniref:hypothetical protein n=1 Tax=Alteromonas macleodii TaxID=28108 RepID=UPI0030D4C9A4